MPTHNGDNYAKSINPTSDNILAPGTLGGRVRVMLDTVTLAAAAINDVVNFGKKLNAGAQILKIYLYNATLGAGVTLDVGDADSENRYLNAVDGNTADQKESVVAPYTIGTNDDDDVIQMKIEGGVATGAVRIMILYTED
jgi:hypothetical protein